MQAASFRLRRASALACAGFLFFMLNRVSYGQTTYTYYSGTSNAYLNASHWTVGGTTSLLFPGVDNNSSSTADGATNDIATIGAIGFTASTGFGINFNTNSATGVTANTGANGTLTLGAFDFLSGLGSNLQIGNSASTLAGVLALNGVTLNSTSNTIISNEGSKNITFAPQQSGTGTTTPMTIALGNATNNVIQVNGSGNIVVTTAISQVNSGSILTISGGGSGTVTLSGVNTFSGGLVASSSEVDVTSDTSLGAAGGSITINGGRVGFATNNTTIDPTRTFYLGANPTGANTAGTLSIKGSITVTYNGAFQNLNANTIGDIVKQGGGTLQLGGVSTYSGNTFLNNGITQLTSGNNRLPTGTMVNLGQAASTNLGTLDLNGFNQQVAGLNSVTGTSVSPTLKNTVTSAAAATLTLGGSGIYSYGNGSLTNSGVITGAISIIKNGTGTQTLGDANTYSGGTTISGGKLIVANANTSGNSATGSGAVAVNSGGTLASIAGTSRIENTGGNVSINSGGTVSPGDSGTVGVLTTGTEAWNTGGAYVWEISNASGAPGNGWDEIELGTAILTIGSTSSTPFTLQITRLAGATVVQGQTFTIAHAGSVAGFDPNAFVLPDSGGQTWQASVVPDVANGGVDFQVTVTPEPGSMSLLGIVGLGLLCRRRTLKIA